MFATVQATDSWWKTPVMFRIKMGITNFVIFTAFTVLYVSTQSVRTQSHYNPTILQDSRDLPKTDGRFGFLYRTEDGIAHAAKSEGDGIVHGRYTYSDPTGFKLNFNYNAGTRVTPGYNYDQPLQQAPAPVAPAPVAPAQDNYQRQYSAPNDNDDVYQNVQTVRSRPPALRNRNDLYDNYYQ